VRDSELLEEIRERRRMAALEWDEIQAEAKKDRLCVAGDVWGAMDPDGKKQRLDKKRPCLSSDELNQYINQWINGVRENPRSIRFAPTGNGANDKGAEFYQNYVREIEYRSHAQMAYCTAGGDAATSSIGWLRIKAKREHMRTFNQELWIEPIVNPDQVLPDPSGVWPDSRDIKFLFYVEPWTLKEFNRRFPKAKHKSFGPELRSLAHGWIGRNGGLNRDIVQVGEYWKLETYTRTLVAYQRKGEQPMMALLDELPDEKLPEGTENIREEEVDDERVEAWLTNGLELLEEIEWRGKYLPFVSCMGKQIYVDGGAGSTRRILSLTRLARDPAMFHAYVVTCEAESIGGIPRGAYTGYRGQFAKPDVWAKAAHEPVPFLEANATTEGSPPGQVLPLPIKGSWDPPIQNLEILKGSVQRAIQSAFGVMPSPTPQQPHDRISGIAKEKFDSSAQRGSFHFNDNFDLMIERTGVILEDAIPHYVDTMRDVAVRQEVDGDGSVVHINDPRGSVMGPGGQVSGDPIFTKGDYRTTVSTGPATESQRAEASDFVDALLANIANIMQIGGPPVAKMILAKSIKLKQLGPIGDEIVNLLEPPRPGKDGKPLPPEAQALMGQVQQLQSALQKAQQEIQSEQVKVQGQIAVAQVKQANDVLLQKMKDATSIAVAKIAALKGMAIAMGERQDEAIALQVSALHEERLADKAHAHEASESAKDRAHEVGTIVQEHAHSIEKATVEHQHALESATKMAALQPDEGSANG
jgi:hypothetical protein